MDIGVSVLAVGISGFAAWSGASLISIGLDWGYELTKTLCGQPDSNQGVIAAMSLWHFAVFKHGFGDKCGCFFVFILCLHVAIRRATLLNAIGRGEYTLARPDHVQPSEGERIEDPFYERITFRNADRIACRSPLR